MNSILLNQQIFSHRLQEEKKRKQKTDESLTAVSTNENASEADKTICKNLSFAGPNSETLVKKDRRNIHIYETWIEIRGERENQRRQLRQRCC